MTGNYFDIVDFFANIISSFIAVEYIYQGFEKKQEGIKKLLLFLCGWGGYFGVLLFLTRENKFEGISGLAYAAVLLIYGMFALKGRFQEKVLFGILWTLIALVSSYILFGLCGILTSKSLEMLFSEKSNGIIIANIVNICIKFLLGRLVIWCKKMGGYRMSNSEDWTMIGILSMIYLLVTGIFYLEKSQTAQGLTGHMSLYFLLLFCFIISFSGYLYYKLGNARQRRLETEIYLSLMETGQENLKQILKKEQEIRKIRHDLKSSVEVLYQLIKSNHNSEALRYIEGISETLKHTISLPQDTGNEGMNSALIYMLHECHERQMDFRYLIGASLKDYDNMDMGILFSNLFSNALEASSMISCGKIELDIKKSGNWLVCRLENSVILPVLKENSCLKTTKPNSTLHGFGMERIKEIINKYSGEYACTDVEGVFIQNFALKQPN